MTVISAANNLSIDLSSGGWKLRYAAGFEDPLAEASNEGLAYTTAFADARHLPDEGLLPTAVIDQVVLGWQKSDECWHLGLLLRPEAAEPRGSRWCELARWPDPDQTLFADQAHEVGERAAILLDVPFQFIQPEPLTPPEPPRPLPDLPLALGGWQLVNNGSYLNHALREGQLALVRQPDWVRANRRRVFYKFGWALLYAGVSILTLISPIDLPNAGTLIPNPHILPYLGLLISVGLVVYGLYQYARFKSAVSLVTIDERSVMGYNAAGPLWEVMAIDARSLYSSEILKSSRKLVSEYGEINVHLGGGVFQRLIRHDVPLTEHTSALPSKWQAPTGSSVQPLTRSNYYTDLQAASLYIGETLKLPVWADVRVSGFMDQFLRMR